eukprot:12442264-Prorocentrum_lima.AAC.1
MENQQESAEGPWEGISAASKTGSDRNLVALNRGSRIASGSNRKNESQIAEIKIAIFEIRIADN